MPAAPEMPIARLEADCAAAMQAARTTVEL
jgi:hypothetical protein